jgi:flagellar basal body-associated protein FliL
MQKKYIIILASVIVVLLIAGGFAYTQWQKAEQKLAAM